MGTVMPLEALLDARRVWRGQSHAPPSSTCPTGHAELDAALPTGGWPEAALSELLVPAPGVGELQLLWPTLARLSAPASGESAAALGHATGKASGKRQAASFLQAADGRVIAVIAPPWLPYAPAWQAAGVYLPNLQVVRCDGRDALWAAEQCLRSAACAAVLCWPSGANDRALRRLQVAAETGQCLGFAFRDPQAARNPSPAALRLLLQGGSSEGVPPRVHVLKCRGGAVPAHPIPLRAAH
ncbi:CDP-6-deoxy-delta-3,4-glucoseen reductase [Lysobacter daejeonensis GH1-9]|uniref:CDP-6-deoxy-delta-3,4-glucoseen reductase n=1 Tax=Lysobacter daejeonensis GH1-9 TaxID=1385517 RepID=A0A0A0F4M2_9GAMM|nr:DNA lesion error-prone repair protein ImuA [Lysobacter daejeonensis]KGM56317.1 CDP-6-deoxy-delta-3,4-glucoseen reductase [Lysobacter daejeonensis GH1-9]